MKDNKKYYLIEFLYFVLMGGLIGCLVLKYSTKTSYEFLIVLFIELFLLMMVLLFKPKINRPIVTIITLLICTYLMSQDVYNRAFFLRYKLSYAFSMLKTVSEFTGSALEVTNISDFYYLFYIVVVDVVFGYIYHRYQRNIEVKYNFYGLLLIIPLICICFVYNKKINDLNDNDYFDLEYNDYYIYKSLPATSVFTDRFGVLCFGVRDISLMIDNASINENREEIDAELNSHIEPGDNQVSDIFENKNVMFIQAESLTDVAIIDWVTPYMAMFKNEGIYIDGFNTPLLYGSTSDSEFMVNTSIIPDSSEGSVCLAYPNNSYKTTLAKLFNDKGYSSTIIHNASKNNFNRAVISEKFGYQNQIFSDDIDGSKEMSDYDFMQIMLDKIDVNKEKQMFYWVTYSGHQPYTEDSIGASQENMDYIHLCFPELNEANSRYLAKTKDLDDAIGLFIEKLKSENVLENWVFVLYGDHKAKTIDYSEDGDLYNHIFKDNCKSDTDLIIYNSQDRALYYAKYATCLDVMPTIANMFNLDLDYKTIFGHDIFDENYHGFYFDEFTDWITNDYTYNFINDKVIVFNSGLSEEEALTEARHYKKIKEICKMIIKSDYFSSIHN